MNTSLNFYGRREFTEGTPVLTRDGKRGVIRGVSQRLPRSTIYRVEVRGFSLPLVSEAFTVFAATNN